MDRKKTSSVTELVKEVAKEVFKKGIDDHNIICHQYDARDIVRDHLDRHHKSNVEKVTTGLNCYQKWDETEDEKLKHEFRILLNAIAVSHGRTTGSIRCRFEQMLKNGDLF